MFKTFLKFLLYKQQKLILNSKKVVLLQDGYIDQEKIVPKTETQVYFYNLSASNSYIVDVFTNGVGNQKNKESTYVVFGKSYGYLF